jgi:predicted tellurium resistance membrane protein TerC
MNWLSLIFAMLGLVVAAAVWKRTHSSHRALPYAVGGLMVASGFQIARVLLEQGA